MTEKKMDTKEAWVQVFEHYPDRLYRRDVFSHYEGILPLDMVVVKPEFQTCPNKPKGMIGCLEYDNMDDRSFELPDYPLKNPKQPIRKDILYYHLARTRGHNFEYRKRLNYERLTHPTKAEWELEQNCRMNQWVSGLYPMEKVEVPSYIPTKVIPNPKVSVIIPCYNKAKWIGETIESCLNQTYKPYEIIVVDDGSTDNSVEVISGYGVTLHKQSNQGVAVARNNGLNKATGDYFILLDGDDLLGPTYIEETLKEMKGDIQVVFTDFQGIGEWNWRHHYSGNMEDLKVNQCIPSTMALCDMRVLDPYGNFKPEAHYEDFEFWLNLYFNRKVNFKHIPKPLCFYRRTKGTRVDLLDQKKQEGYDQIRKWYGQFGVNPQ